VTAAPRSRTRAAQALCEILDKTATTLPGSRLRIRFADIFAAPYAMTSAGVFVSAATQATKQS
jgi:hypothetical protein